MGLEVQGNYLTILYSQSNIKGVEYYEKVSLSLLANATYSVFAYCWMFSRPGM